jgi:quercetin dioxygenase-like cupin family protein
MSKVSFSALEDNGAFKVLQTQSEKGAKMNRHYSDRDAFFMIQSGSVSFNLNNEIISLESGDHLKIPALHIHSFTVLEDCKALLILSKEAKIQFIQED